MTWTGSAVCEFIAFLSVGVAECCSPRSFSSMDVDDVREVTIGSLAVAPGGTAGLVLTFWVVLHPVELQGCNSSRPGSDFKRALVPAHVLAAFAASACLWLVSAARRGREM